MCPDLAVVGGSGQVDCDLHVDVVDEFPPISVDNFDGVEHGGRSVGSALRRIVHLALLLVLIVLRNQGQSAAK
eukprot:SAG31_NODE_1597_length_7799_cov_37.912857_2_plen_73_part_00